MNSLLDLSGQISIHLRWDNGVIQDVQLHNSRPQQLTHFFTGKPLTEVLNLIPLLYSLCGMAQQVAALRAAESALAIEVSPDVERARELLLEAETVRELGFRLLTDWMPDKSHCNRELMGWFTALKQQYAGVLKVQPHPLPEPLTAEALQLHSRALQQLLEQIAECPLTAQPDAAVCDRLLNRLVARLPAELSALLAEQPSAMVNAPAPSLDRLLAADADWLIHALEQQGDYFCAQPDYRGQCHETSVWSRCADAGVLEHCNPLRARLSALINELIKMPARIADPLWVKPPAFAEPGYGKVTAARGLLIHHIDLQGETVADSRVNEYRIVAPTEWNFHPRGTLVQMLEGVRVSEAQLRPLLESLIRLVDPCVSWQLNVDINHA